MLIFFRSTIAPPVSSLPYTPPLDVYSNCIGGYSVRKLSTAYAGACMRICNDAGTETDIGFDSNGLVNTSDIVSFVGSGQNAWIVKWYDQSGTANHLDGSTTLTNRLRISLNISSEGIRFINGIPALGVSSLLAAAGENMSLKLPSTIEVGSMFCVGNLENIVSIQFQYIAWGSTDSDGIFVGGINASATGMGTVTAGAVRFRNTTENLNQRLWTYISGATDFVYTDGANSASGVIAPININELGRTIENGGGGNLGLRGNRQEYLIFSDSKSADRVAIETNINDYFSIY